MKDKAPKAKSDDDSSQQPRQQHTPSAKEQSIIETEDRIKERESFRYVGRQLARRQAPGILIINLDDLDYAFAGGSSSPSYVYAGGT